MRMDGPHAINPHKVENHDGTNDVDAADDTATESYDGDSTDQESQFSYDDDDNGRPLPMPPLKYARIMGCLPRDGSSTSISVKITASTMGRVVIQPLQHPDKILDSSMSSSSRHGDGPRKDSGEWTDADEEVDMALIKVHHVLALGFEDGKVRLVDVLTGGSVLFGSSPDDGGAWFVNPSTAKLGYAHISGSAIVALSFDSSSSYLSALNANGDAAIFGPLIWGRQNQGIQSALSGVRLGFLSSFGGKVAESTSSDYERSHTARPAFTLVKPPALTVRFSYADTKSFTSSLLGGGSSSVGHIYHPTCMVLDPSYARRKERALIVGFNDGRLLLSKIQGASGLGSGITTLFGGGAGSAGGGTVVTKVDSELYQGTGVGSFSGDNAGIESVTWRGGLVAWADSSGVRIFDIEFMSRIAHIDRPTGARGSLYPTISSLYPSIFFERADSLLIAWGDCLMAMVVRDTLCTIPASKDGISAKEIKRKTVEVTMAWELDFVACSVVPMDEKHVAVLGLVPSPTQPYDGGKSDQLTKSSTSFHASSIAGGNNVLELQIINREDGKSISNDRLPLSGRYTQRQGDEKIATANATEFRLLSSFACPRMDGFAEWDALGTLEKEEVEREALNLGSELTSGKILDYHLRWDITQDVCSVGNDLLSEAVIYDDDRSVASDCSIFSDNYVFALSEPIGDILPLSDFPARSSPPTMTIVSSYDACQIQTRDVDDVISYTRSLGKPALALRQALAHRRDVRRHGFDLLVDDFFTSLLRMGNRRRERPLSFSRLKIAAESLPILLGGDPRMWQRWIFMFSRVPGGLFVISEKIPVRDPELPPFVFEMCLEKMLGDVLSNCNGQDHDTRAENPDEDTLVGEKMADLFFDTLKSWGTTSALRRRVRFHRYFVQNQQWGLQWRSLAEESTVFKFTQRSETILQRRFNQTAFGVLANEHHSTMRQCIDSSRDSLFDVGHLLGRLAARLQLRDNRNMAENDRSSNVMIGSMKSQCVVLLESMAELELMRVRFDRALGYYLALGSHLMDDSLTNLEETAVRIVNSFEEDSINPPAEGQEVNPEKEKYSFVLSLIELHQLTHLLIKRNFFFDNEVAGPAAKSPVVALILLVGLSRAGRFLIENCSLPEDMHIDNDDESALRGSNLPLDCVAKQLKPWPKLLYWFLFHAFVHKAEIYVTFPTTAVPPPAIIELHRTQFSLFVDYAVANESEPMDRQTPSSLVNCRDTPFMSFLRAALPYGGIQAGEVRERLEIYRGGNVNSPFFARELAFVIEHFGEGTIVDANEILQLYLHGAKNLHLAVAFAERSRKYSDQLWDKLIEHCTTPSSLTSGETQNSTMGALFGSLLEAAAHSGSDVANLVSKIPTGMPIEGLRPKLIAAVTDYRYKLKMHDNVATIFTEDKLSIIRELSHGHRRGERILVDKDNSFIKTKDHAWLKPSDLLKCSRQKIFPSYSSFCLPIR